MAYGWSNLDTPNRSRGEHQQKTAYEVFNEVLQLHGFSLGCRNGTGSDWTVGLSCIAGLSLPASQAVHKAFL